MKKLEENHNIRQGLTANMKQFVLLVVINAFVGGMIGLERSILPRIAEAEFHMAVKTAILSFIIVFGIVKAVSNYFAGSLANRIGRKNLLTIGWLFAILVPFILMNAESWNWILFANVLLGINQGLSWSSTVVMKIELVGEKNRGLAMGLNEFAGYIALASVAFITGSIAENYGLRPYPFYIGIAIAFAGLLSSWLFVKDTRHHVEIESSNSRRQQSKHLFYDTTFKDRNLSSVTQAGLVNNLNDGMIWGLLPMLLIDKGFNLAEIGMITAIYPAIWGIGQLATGKISDHVSKRTMITLGMIIQGLALLMMAFAETYSSFLVSSALLGIGTAMVYPTFLSSIAEHTHPRDRARSIGIFRLWRDLGYAIGAILTALIADQFGIEKSIIMVAVITVFSGLIVRLRME